MPMKGPPSDTPNLDDVLARDFAELKVGEANLDVEAESGQPTEQDVAPEPTTAPLVYNQRIDAVEDRESFGVRAPTSTKEQPPEADDAPPAPPAVLKTPTSTLGDDFDVDW
jgi:hypothetical protein